MKSAELVMPSSNDQYLDDRDRRLLDILRSNARTPVTALARVLNLSRTAVRHRMDRLEQRGAIVAYTIKGKAAVMPVQALVTVTLNNASCAQLKAEVGHLLEVRKIWSVAGDVDTFVLLEAATIEDVRRVAQVVGTSRHVRRASTHIVLDQVLNR